MRVYRLETDGWGVFCGIVEDFTTFPEDAIYQNMGNSVVGVNVFQTEMRFACPSIDALIEYFGSDFDRLIRNIDVKIVEYEVKAQDVYMGCSGQELAFRVDNAKRFEVE